MNSSTTAASALTPSSPHATPASAPSAHRHFWRSDTAIYLVITALVLLAWWVSTRGWYTSWSNKIGRAHV